MLIHDAMTLSLRKKAHFPEQLVRMIVALCGSIGTLWVLNGFFDFPIRMKPLILFLLAMTLTLRIIRMISPKIGFVCILSAFAIIPLLLVHYREPAVVGAGAVYHVMRKRILWQIAFPPTEATAGDWSEAECIQFVFFMIVIALVALLEYSDVLLSHVQSSRSGFWIRFLVTFPFLECGLYFGIETSSIAVFMMIFFWIGTIALARRKPSRRMAASQGISAQLQLSFLTDNEQRMTTHETGTAFILAGALMLALTALHSSANYVRTEEMNQKRKDLRDFYRNITIDDVMGVFDRLPGSFGPNVVTDEVDLLQNGDLHFDGRPALHLSIGGAAAVDDYYMRGVVRSEYTGRGWGIPSNAYRRNQRLFRRLTEENRMPQTLFHSDHADELRTPEGKFPVVRCEVHALNKENVNYLPYQSIFDIGTRYRYDTETELNSTENYTFWILNNAKFNWPDIAEQSAPSQEKIVSSYEKFVEEEYLKLPDTEAIHRIAEAAKPYMPPDNLPLDQQLAAIRDYIWERADYSLQPGAQPQDQDFVEYFLTTGRKGFCAHYASAAVVLCRMCGIPARYCQGYVLTQNDFLLGRTGEDYEINIPDYQAHAWAEIYVKGYGWIPFEFTETVLDTWHRPIETTPTETVLVTETTATLTVTEAAASNETAAKTSAAAETTTTAVTGTGSEALPGSTSPEFAAKLLRIFGRILLAAAVPALYYLLHRLILKRREKAMRSKDPNQAAQAAYQFLIYLLHIQGINQEKLSHDEFSELAETKCSLLPHGSVTRAIAIQQAAVFSRNGITQPEAKVLRKTAKHMADAMYRNAGLLRKIWLRWGRHII